MSSNRVQAAPKRSVLENPWLYLLLGILIIPLNYLWAAPPLFVAFVLSVSRRQRVPAFLSGALILLLIPLIVAM